MGENSPQTDLLIVIPKLLEVELGVSKNVGVAFEI
jgi:hypothetical protein